MTDTTEIQKKGLLDSELAYIKEDRLSLDDLINKKKSHNSLIQIQSKEYNAFIEQTILCHQALELAESNVREIANDYNDREHKIMERGFKMLSEPFIPEYAGFKQKEVKEGNVIYEIKDFLLVSIGEEWVLFGKGDSPIHIKLNNMYQAVATLSALGVGVSVEEVLNSN